MLLETISSAVLKQALQCLVDVRVLMIMRRHTP